MKLELRIFICFIIAIGYVMYGDLYKSKEQTLTTVKQQTVGGFEIRLINDYANERLEVTSTLGQALAYIEKYSMHHNDLIAFDLSTGDMVASSEGGVGVIHASIID